MDRVIVFDTTLRDGEQSPGASLTLQEKVDIAKQLEKLRVDIIEAGFPVTSPGDFEAVRLISREVRGASICALTDARAETIDHTWEALKDGADPLLHIVLSSSDIHIQEMLRSSREQVLEWAVDVVKHARRHTSNIEFSPMDASRTDPAFLHRLLGAVIDAGAAVVNIPDTVGYAYPEEFGGLISGIMEKVPNVHRARVSVHCHDDLGMAVPNTLEALRRGARQFEATINGIGERAGNAALEEIVMALSTRADFFDLETRIDLGQIYRTSRLVSDLTGIVVQPNKAVVGANAFRHSSGLHIDGMLKERTTFEIMDPAALGRASALVLGKTSGRHAVRHHLARLSLEVGNEEFPAVFAAFKRVADRKRQVSDDDLRAILGEVRRTASEVLRLERLEYHGSEPPELKPTASVRLAGLWKRPRSATSSGDGPVDAIYNAINRLVRLPVRLDSFRIEAVGSGKEALGEVTVTIERDGAIYTGRGASTDIVIASAKAYLNALNRLITSQQGAQEQR